MNRRRLEAIVAVKHTLIRRFEKGFMLRGVDIEVTLNMDNFAGEGDVNLFGEMLHRFFALYADIHLFNQLTLVLQTDRETTEMARESQPARTGLTLALDKDIWRVNFYRFCQLLEQENPDAPKLGTTSHPGNDPVRFRPPGMGFPVSTLKAVETDEDHPTLPPTVRTTFLGMYGVDSLCRRLIWMTLHSAGRL